MTKCPKCSCISISEPRYVKTAYGERLRYTCNRCGYSKTEPCHDAADKTYFDPETMKFIEGRQSKSS